MRRLIVYVVCIFVSFVFIIVLFVPLWFCLDYLEAMLGCDSFSHFLVLRIGFLLHGLKPSIVGRIRWFYVALYFCLYLFLLVIVLF